MTIEAQLAAIAADVKRIADLLPTLQKNSVPSSEPSPTPEPTSRTGDVSEETAPTATEVMEKEKPAAKTKEEKPATEITFPDISTEFFSYLANVRAALGRDKAKTIARALLDRFQSEPGKPLDIGLVNPVDYANFYKEIQEATARLEEHENDG